MYGTLFGFFSFLIKIQNRSHEMKNRTTANKNTHTSTHTVARRINMINDEEEEKNEQEYEVALSNVLLCPYAK